MTTGHAYNHEATNQREPLPPLDLPSHESIDISHELRTPLAAIQGALELLSSGQLGSLSSRGHRMLKIAANNVDRLIRLTTALEQTSTHSPDFLSPDDLAQLRLETDLASALANQELVLYYQPLVSLKNSQIIGFETLLRWEHPVFGILLPATFIPIAEETGLIIDIGTWTIHEACHQLKDWQQRFSDQVSSLSISVNLSSKQLAAPALVQQIETILKTTKLPLNSLKLEITESAIMENASRAELILGQIQALGVQLYIDDFGTGYSSLSRLLELPLDVLKIDRSFTQQLDSEKGEYLVSTIAKLAKNLGVDLIAEGVETAAQVQKLQQLGCDKGQGYFFAKPLDKTAAEKLITDMD